MTALTHIALDVTSTEQSAGFYTQWCGMEEVHRRTTGNGDIVWLSSPGYKEAFVLVLLPGRERPRQLHPGHSGHLGFAVEAEEDVHDIARKGQDSGILIWDVEDHGPPVGVLCGIQDPDGHVVEFSYGQPIGFDRG